MKSQVLDKGFIEVVDSLGNDLTVVNSARVSFGKRKTVWSASDRRLCMYLAKYKHYSPFRHLQVQFHIKAPEFVMRQWYKHVVGIETTSNSSTKDHAWNEISGRYVVVEDFYTPEVFRKQSEDNKQASDGLHENQWRAERLWTMGQRDAFRAYRAMIDMGVAREQARCILPLTVYTKVWWTASFQSIMNFIELRDEPTSQVEIQEYARAMKKIVLTLYPESSKLWSEIYFDN